MARKKHNEYKKTRKPIFAIICEGRNKTEKLYFEHFKKRENEYALKIFDSEATDIKNIIKKAKNISNKYQLDSKLNDKVFCIIDLDLSVSKYRTLEEEIQKLYKNSLFQFVLSNPCFEVWLLYYFTKNPKVEISSQKVKDQLRKYVPQYNENFDIVEKCKLQDKVLDAINNAELKNEKFDDETPIFDRNPYTDIPKLLNQLLDLKNK